MSASWHWLVANLDTVGFVLGVLGIAAAFYYGRQARKQQSKIVDWRLLANEAVVAVGPPPGAPARLSIQWDGVNIQHPRIIAVGLVNTGRMPILSKDYTKPITIDLPGSKVLAASVTSTSYKDVQGTAEIAYTIGGGGVKITPALLNPKDWIELQVVVDGGANKRPQVSARFAGQSRPMADVSEWWLGASAGALLWKGLSRTLAVSVGGGVLGTAVVFLSGGPRNGVSTDDFAFLMFLIVFIGSVVLLLALLFAVQQTRRLELVRLGRSLGRGTAFANQGDG